MSANKRGGLSIRARDNLAGYLFIAPSLIASGGATLWNGEMLTFLFTPQDSSDYMVTVAEIMASFRVG